MSDDNYYVYKYLREDGTPYYIGKGKKRRAWSKNHTVSVPSNDRIIIIRENLSAEQALNLEVELISKYGRKDLGTGILRNQTDGGDGIINPSEKWRKQKSESMRGDNNPSRRPGASEKISESQSRPEVILSKQLKMSGSLAPHYGKFGTEHPRYGIKESDKTRSLKSMAHTGKKLSQDHKNNIGKSHSGKSKPHSGWGNTNTKGRKWYNDGKKSYMLNEDDMRIQTLNKGRLYE